MKFQPLKKTLVGLALSLYIAGFTMPAHAAEAPKTYVTQANDTFWFVSKKLKVRMDELLAANPSIDPLNVYEGQTWKVPSEGMTAAAARVAAVPVSAKLNTTKAKSVAASDPTPLNLVQTVSGEAMEYSKVITGIATAYSESPQENGGWGAVDYFGAPLHIGTIAVDPKVIPLGKKVYITGYTFDGIPKGLVAAATDVGGAINGNRVDIFIPSSVGDVASFGMQNVQIYVLK